MTRPVRGEDISRWQEDVGHSHVSKLRVNDHKREE